MRNLHRIITEVRPNVEAWPSQSLWPNIRPCSALAELWCTSMQYDCSTIILTVPVVCSSLPLCPWHSTDVPVWQPAAAVRCRRCLRSADTATLQVPSTRQATLGDHSFPVAAERAWNSLPPETRPAPHFWHFGGRPSLGFLVSHTADLALSIQTVSRHLRWAAWHFSI